MKIKYNRFVMKHFYLILTLASLVGASVPVSAQISIDEVNAERR